MDGCTDNILLRTVTVYRHRREAFYFSVLSILLTDISGNFSLWRKNPVYPAGKNPNPADFCPTGRDALSQVCHFISAVKSIRSISPLRVSFSWMHSICIYFLLFLSQGIFFSELKFPGVYKKSLIMIIISYFINPLREIQVSTISLSFLSATRRPERHTHAGALNTHQMEKWQSEKAAP